MWPSAVTTGSTFGMLTAVVVEDPAAPNGDEPDDGSRSRSRALEGDTDMEGGGGILGVSSFVRIEEREMWGGLSEGDDANE